MGKNALQTHVRRGGNEFCQLHQLRAGEHARPYLSSFHLDQDVRRFRGTLEKPGNSGNLLPVVHPHAEPRFCDQVAEPGELQVAVDLVGDENVVHAVFGHDFRLADLGHCDALRSGLHLHGRDRGGPVGLRVGSQGDTRPVSQILHSRYIAEQNGPVHKEGGSIKAAVQVFHCCRSSVLQASVGP
ncbi:hypothetical protein SDC9_47964 [bioreactor metagenome]|uniref:Uncharacterized protein n=1 Tax=bioreactor metagenome TaxID=1076179 RepID=A0A644WHG6_9ZZZZ